MKVSTNEDKAPVRKAPKSTVGKLLYYGFAVDSFQRSFGRLKKSTVTLGPPLVQTIKKIKLQQYEAATSTEDIESTFTASAHNIVVAFLFTLFFMSFAIFKQQDLLATLLNTALGIVFFFRMICFSIVYLKAKEELRIRANN